MKVDTRFPEADPILQTAKAILFKSDASKGGPPLFLWTRFAAPITAEIITPVEARGGSLFAGFTALFAEGTVLGGAGSRFCD